MTFNLRGRIAMPVTLIRDVELTTMQCGSCGIVFAMPSAKYDQCRTKGGNFFCPNGHARVFREPDVKRLERELAQERQQHDQCRADRDHAENRARTLKGVVTKKRKQLDRVSKGVCPCCNRSFENLHRHMQTKHPEFQEATT